MSNPKLGRFELCRRDSFTQRQEQDVDEFLEEIRFQRLSGKSPLKSEDGISEQAGFNQICLRDAEFFVGRLQIAIVK